MLLFLFPWVVMCMFNFIKVSNKNCIASSAQIHRFESRSSFVYSYTWVFFIPRKIFPLSSPNGLIFSSVFFITTKNQPDRWIIPFQSLLFLEVAHINVHLPDVLMRERTNLQINKHKTFFPTLFQVPKFPHIHIKLHKLQNIDWKWLRSCRGNRKWLKWYGYRDWKKLWADNAKFKMQKFAICNQMLKNHEILSIYMWVPNFILTHTHSRRFKSTPQEFRV